MSERRPNLRVRLQRGDQSRSLPRTVAVRVAIAFVLFVGVLTPAGAADSQDSDRGSLTLAATSGGWDIEGLSLTARVEGAGIAESGNASERVTVAPDDRLYLLDSSGLPLGMLQGESRIRGWGDAPPVRPLSYLIDRERQEIIVAWSPVDGADGFQVLLKEESTGVVSPGQPLEARIPLHGLAENDLISVVAMNSQAESRDAQMLATLSLLVSPFMLGDTPLPLSLFTEPPVKSMGSFSALALPSTTTLRFTTFIPEKYVAAPAIVCSGGGVNKFFGGDNRGFSATSSAYRTRASWTAVWSISNSSANQTSGVVSATKLYKKSGDTYTLEATKTASATGIKWSGMTSGGSKRNYTLNHKVTDPFCSSIAALDYNVSGQVSRVAGYKGFSATGKHDRAPNYEFYFSSSDTSWQRFYGWNHGAYFCLSACTMKSFSVSK